MSLYITITRQLKNETLITTQLSLVATLKGDGMISEKM